MILNHDSRNKIEIKIELKIKENVSLLIKKLSNEFTLHVLRNEICDYEGDNPLDFYFDLNDSELKSESSSITNFNFHGDITLNFSFKGLNTEKVKLKFEKQLKYELNKNGWELNQFYWYYKYTKENWIFEYFNFVISKSGGSTISNFFLHAICISLETSYISIV